MANKLYCELSEFNEAAQPKTSLAKYSIEFNDLAVQKRPHRIPYLKLLGRPYTLLYVNRSVGRLTISRQFLDSRCRLKSKVSSYNTFIWFFLTRRNSVNEKKTICTIWVSFVTTHRLWYNQRKDAPLCGTTITLTTTIGLVRKYIFY